MSKDIASRVQYGEKWNLEQPHVPLWRNLPLLQCAELMVSLIKI